MARSRSSLQTILEELIGSPNKVYFQPPESVKMSYPCIVYKRDQAKIQFADDHPYVHAKRYQITVIDRNPDSEIPDKVAMLPMCSFTRFFTADNLNHDVYDLYF